MNNIVVFNIHYIKYSLKQWLLTGSTAVVVTSMLLLISVGLFKNISVTNSTIIAAIKSGWKLTAFNTFTEFNNKPIADNNTMMHGLGSSATPALVSAILKGDSEGDAYFRTYVNKQRNGLISDDPETVNTPLSAQQKIERLAGQIQASGANMYFYLMRRHDPDQPGTGDKYWQEFVQVVAALHNPDPSKSVDVMLYLVAPAGGSDNVPPYYSDYGKWAREVARLSMDASGLYTNLKGIVLDDVSYQSNVQNRIAFTPLSIQTFVNEGRKIDPYFKFYAITYYRDILGHDAFKLEDYLGLYDYANRPCLDGIVVPYLNLDYMAKGSGNNLVYSQETDANRMSARNNLALQMEDIRSRCNSQVELLAMIYDSALSGYAAPRSSDVVSSTRTALYLANKGVIAGVIQHDLPKQPAAISPLYPLIKALYSGK